MKKTLIILAVLAMASGLAAQVRTGNIYGKITDSERNPLPGVTVTLTGPQMAAMTTVTNEAGNYRFPSIPPGNEYVIAAELQGFKKASKTGVIVTLGSNSEINLLMEIGALEEQVTVVAVTPVVDSKKTAVAMNVTKEEMQSLPTARDPWVVMQLAPSIMLDRENVGGNESGQQASFLSKGDMANSGYYGANNIWAVDGIDITDPAALGGSALYYDFDMFEELNITTGGADVSIQTGGVALNMVTRRGGNKMSLAGRFYLTDNFFQATNLTPELQAQGVRATNKIQQIKDYGFNAGGPLIKDKVWWWGAYGVQDLFTYTVYSTKDQSLLNNYNFKVNAQVLKNNRFEALVTSGAKEKLGRNASVAKPEGDHQIGKYYWGSPVIKLQDEHVFGNNLYLSLKYSFNDAGFGWTPMVDPETQYPVVYDNTNKKYIAYGTGMNASWDYYYASRPRNNYQLQATYFNDGLLGLSHEIKVGAEYSHKIAEHKWGTAQNFTIQALYNTPIIDLNADGTREVTSAWKRIDYQREGRDNGVADQTAGYIQDTITKGNFTFLLGLRYDFQQGSMDKYPIDTTRPGTPAWKTVFADDVVTKMTDMLPGISVNRVKPDYNWKTWSPRLGLTWDLTGDGKTVAKIFAAQYGDVMGTATGVNMPLGTGGWARYWWNDGNGDAQIQANEMYWLYSSLSDKKYQPYRIYDDAGNFIGDPAEGRNASMYGGFDWSNKTFVDYSNPGTYWDPSAHASTRTRELLLVLERELLPDLGVAANFTFRRYDNFDKWQSYWPDQNKIMHGDEWWIPGGVIPATVGGESTGGAAGKTWYRHNPALLTANADYSWVEKSKQYNDYLGLDLVLNKRLSNRWFMNTSLTLQDQKSNWNGSPTMAVGYDYWSFNPTNTWAFDGKPYAMSGGGASGKTSINMYTRWMFKISGLYQLPWDFNISGTFQAREGWRIPHYFWIEDALLGGLEYGTYVYTQEVTKDALPTFYNLTLRLEKRVSIGAGRMYFMADAFNILNSAIVNRAYDAYLGEYYADQDLFVPNPTKRFLNEILNPRIIRFGVRFEF